MGAYRRFFEKEIWITPYDAYTGIRAGLAKGTRILLASIQGFIADECYVRASALTYLTLMSIVPVLAVIFGVARGFGVEQFLERELYTRFSEHTAAVDRVLTFTYSMIEHTHGSLIAGVGIASLFGIVLMGLNSIERTLNRIWKVAEGRSFLRMIGDYTAIMLISPILIIASSSLTVFILRQAARAAQEISFFATVTPFVSFIIRLLPYGLAWVLFILIYLLMPNRKVPIRYALIAGFIAGTLYQTAQWGYLHSQILAASYGAIYGSFAAVPLFLIWLQLSWAILLFGAEIACHAEKEAFHYGHSHLPHPATRESVARYLAVRVSQGFTMGKTLTARDLAKEIGAPLSAVEELLDTLAEGGVLARFKWHYLPAQGARPLTVEAVRDALAPELTVPLWVQTPPFTAFAASSGDGATPLP